MVCLCYTWLLAADLFALSKCFFRMVPQSIVSIALDERLSCMRLSGVDFVKALLLHGADVNFRVMRAVAAPVKS
jgi:hypothetical protein